jgi:hypothetical protein
MTGLFSFAAMAVAFACSAQAFASSCQAGGDVRFDAGFDRMERDWNLTNYKDRLTVGVSNVLDTTAFTLTLTNEGCVTPWKLDTGFLLRSRKFGVTPGKDFQIAITSIGTYQMNLARGAMSSFVRWRDGNDKPLKDVFNYTFNVLSNRAYTARVNGRVPKGAASAELVIGADEPNMRTRQHLALFRATFSEYPAGSVPADPEPRPVELFGPPPTKEELSLSHRLIDEKGYLVVDGRRFFPIGIYGFWKTPRNGESFERGIKELKDAGFNTVQVYRTKRTDQFTELLDALDRNDMKIFMSPAEKSFFTVDDIRANIMAEKGRKCLLSWYLADDTSQHNTPVSLRTLHLESHRLDPFHVTSQADGVGPEHTSKYAPFLDSTDVFLPEIYPVTSAVPTGKEVSRVVSEMKTIARDLAARPDRRKSVWPIIQFFEGWSVWKRYPTAKELRAMSFEALIHGAQGITWYTYYGSSRKRSGHGVTWDDGKWAIMSAVSKEIAALVPDLICDNVEKQPQVSVLSGPELDPHGYPSVSVLLKDSSPERLLMAANATTNSVTASIVIDGGDPIVETFEPYGVRTYRIRRN